MMAGTAVAVCGWWYLRNRQLYGEWLGLQTMVAIAGPGAPITLIELFRGEWLSFWRSYWGVFGAFTVLAADWVYRFFDALTLAALAGGLLSLGRRNRSVALDWAAAGLFALFCALTFVGVVRWTLLTLASQGRLMFGAIAPLSIFMAAGLLQLAGRAATVQNRNRTAVALVAALALVAGVIPPLYLAPRYEPPPALRAADLPADLRSVRARLARAWNCWGTPPTASRAARAKRCG